MQEAAIVALAKLDQYTPGTNFRAWMGRIVRFVAMNQARKEQKRRPAGGDSATLAQVSSDRDSSEASRSQHGALDERLLTAMDKLGDVARSCLLLRTISNMLNCRRNGQQISSNHLNQHSPIKVIQRDPREPECNKRSRKIETRVPV